MSADDWPLCRNCPAPVAAHKKTGEPRLYCSDGCREAYAFAKHENVLRDKDARLLDEYPDWPLCTWCGRRPRSVVTKHTARQAGGEVGDKYRRLGSAHGSEGTAPEDSILLWRFCSTSCRSEAVAPYFAVDTLGDLRRGIAAEAVSAK